jgi:hypothetical protein
VCGRANTLSHAKGLICYLGHSRLGLTGKELARYFHISQPSVSQAIQRGEQFAKKNTVKIVDLWQHVTVVREIVLGGARDLNVQ